MLISVLNLSRDCLVRLFLPLDLQVLSAIENMIRSMIWSLYNILQTHIVLLKSLVSPACNFVCILCLEKTKGELWLIRGYHQHKSQLALVMNWEPAFAADLSRPMIRLAQLQMHSPFFFAYFLLINDPKDVVFVITLIHAWLCSSGKMGVRTAHSFRWARTTKESLTARPPTSQGVFPFLIYCWSSFLQKKHSFLWKKRFIKLVSRFYLYCKFWLVLCKQVNLCHGPDQKLGCSLAAHWYATYLLLWKFLFLLNFYYCLVLMLLYFLLRKTIPLSWNMQWNEYVMIIL